MNRSATYDFLLTFHSNHGPISYRFRDKRRFQSKIAEFSHHVYFASQLNGFRLELGTDARGQNTRMMALPGRQRSLTISSAVWIQSTNVTDGRTDTGRQQRPCLRIASRGKNVAAVYELTMPLDDQRRSVSIRRLHSSKEDILNIHGDAH